MVGPVRLGVPKTTFSLDLLYENTVTVVYSLPSCSPPEPHFRTMASNSTEIILISTIDMLRRVVSCVTCGLELQYPTSLGARQGCAG